MCLPPRARVWTIEVVEIEEFREPPAEPHRSRFRAATPTSPD